MARRIAQILPTHVYLQEIALTVRMLMTSSNWFDTTADPFRLDWSVLDAELARAADYHPGVEIWKSGRRTWKRLS